jgi:DNA-binding NtrC family response regulator
MSALKHCRILVAEDDAVIAMDMEMLLQDAGYDVVGPVPSVAAALAVARGRALDAAVLDVNLRDGLVFPVADELERAGVPFILVTGHGLVLVPPRYRARPFVGKPYEREVFLDALSLALQAQSPAQRNPACDPITP